jgi:hypothetical protein
MATAMQEATTSQKSVAERKCRTIIEHAFLNEDENLVRYMEIWEDEIDEEHKRQRPQQNSFYTWIVVRGRWAAEIAPLLPTHIFPETRKMLANRIIDGWVNVKEIDDEVFFAEIMRKWPAIETKMLADTVRRIIQFRTNGKEDRAALTFRILRYLETTSNDPLASLDQTVYRTMFKALGNHAELSDLVIGVKAMRHGWKQHF